MEKDIEFLKLEYQTLRHEIEIVSKELRDIEKYTIVIISAVWVWLVTHSDNIPKEAAPYLWWLPVFVVILGIVRFLGVQQSLYKIANYIADSIEPKFLENEKGWENHLNPRPRGTQIRWWNSSYWWISSYLLWAALLVTSVSIACLAQHAVQAG